MSVNVGLVKLTDGDMSEGAVMGLLAILVYFHHEGQIFIPSHEYDLLAHLRLNVHYNDEGFLVTVVDKDGQHVQ